MKKKTKIIIMATLIISAMIISMIPSYAYAPTYISITIVDEERENSQFTYNIYNEWNQIGYIVMDYDVNGYIRITVAPDGNNLDGASTVYEAWLPTHYYVEVEAFASGDDTITGYLGDNGTDIEYTVEGSLTPDAQHPNINITLHYRPIEPLYTLTQYNTYGNTRYAAGRDAVLSNPHFYNLYTAEEYQQYGQYQYTDGWNESFDYAYELGVYDATHGDTNVRYYTQAEYNDHGKAQYDLGKFAGIHEGMTTSRTLVGVGNVIMSGIVSAGMQFTQNVGIWGTTLASVLVTCIIIALVYFVWKAVRG